MHWAFVVYLVGVGVVAGFVGYFLALKMEQDELMRLVMGLERGAVGHKEAHEEHKALMEQPTEDFISVEILE